MNGNTESKPQNMNDMSEEDIIDLLEEMEMEADKNEGAETKEGHEGQAVEIGHRTPPYGSGMTAGVGKEGSGSNSLSVEKR